MFKPNVSARGVVGRTLCTVLLAAAGGCGSVGAHFVSQTPDGGVVSIPNNSNQWPTYYRNRAEELMRQKCPDGYVIEREEAFEDNPADNGRYPNEDFEYNGGYERIRNYSRKEYYITFRCRPPDLPPPAGDELPPPTPLPH
jgi:hypothetical protein